MRQYIFISNTPGTKLRHKHATQNITLKEVTVSEAEKSCIPILWYPIDQIIGEYVTQTSILSVLLLSTVYCNRRACMKVMIHLKEAKGVMTGS